MKPKKRYIDTQIKEFLKDRMVFIGGPRQVGKTTLGISFLTPSTKQSNAYLNWDDVSDRKKIREGNLPNAKVILLDEIHKYVRWRSLVKGFYDKLSDITKFIVTGSAMLDHYRRGGDSLLGRYRYIRLHPFSLYELNLKTKREVESLIKYGGFPEPYLKKDDKFLKLWHKERSYRIVYDDIRDLENIKDLNSIELLIDILPEKTSSLYSPNSIAEDLEVNYRTVENWTKILEQVYYCFRISPYGAPKIKALKKQKKLYLWDWSEIVDVGDKFENFVAANLLKYCHFNEDTQGDKCELRYLRDVEGREVDFVVLKNKVAEFAVECKIKYKSISKNLFYFKERTKIKTFYIVHLGEEDFMHKSGIRVIPFINFCYEILKV